METAKPLRKDYTLKLTYFKPSGKLYATAEKVVNLRSVVGLSPCCYMNDAVAHVRGLRDHGGQGSLPGLMSPHWDGFILVDCDEGYPCLILPPKEGTHAGY